MNQDAKQIHYYERLIITDKQKDIVYKHKLTLNTYSKNGCYFKIINHKYKLTIIEYINNKVITQYGYSSKGNLSSVTTYYNGNKNYIITTIYDYSLSKKQIKEKRFYSNTYKFLKKENYNKSNKLNTITYFVKGLPYYKENFNANGVIIDSVYYNKQGLKII